MKTRPHTIDTNALHAMAVLSELTDCTCVGVIDGYLSIPREELPDVARFIARMAHAAAAAMAGDAPDQWGFTLDVTGYERALFRYAEAVMLDEPVAEDAA